MLKGLSNYQMGEQRELKILFVHFTLAVYHLSIMIDPLSIHNWTRKNRKNYFGLFVTWPKFIPPSPGPKTFVRLSWSSTYATPSWGWPSTSKLLIRHLSPWRLAILLTIIHEVLQKCRVNLLQYLDLGCANRKAKPFEDPTVYSKPLVWGFEVYGIKPMS